MKRKVVALSSSSAAASASASTGPSKSDEIDGVPIDSRPHGAHSLSASFSEPESSTPALARSFTNLLAPQSGTTVKPPSAELAAAISTRNGFLCRISRGASPGTVEMNGPSFWFARQIDEPLPPAGITNAAGSSACLTSS